MQCSLYLYLLSAFGFKAFSVQRVACSVQRAACSVQRAACSVQRVACSCMLYSLSPLGF